MADITRRQSERVISIVEPDAAHQDPQAQSSKRVRNNSEDTIRSQNTRGSEQWDFTLKRPPEYHAPPIVCCSPLRKWLEKIPFGGRQVLYIVVGTFFLLLIPLLDLFVTYYVDIPNLIENDYGGNATLAAEDHWVQTTALNQFRSVRMSIGFVPVFTLGIWAVICWVTFFGFRWVRL